MWVVGKTNAVIDGIDLARDLLLGGAVERKIAATREFYAS
jgi:anthranilate phosphoribosyltransferase